MKRTALFVRFCLGGGAGVLAYYVAFYFLVEWKKSWYVAWATLAFLINLVITFLTQKFWTFQDKQMQAVGRQAGVYLIVGVLFWISNSSLLYLLVEYWRLEPLTAQVILTVLLSIPSFLVQRWIFRVRPTHV